MFVNSTNPISGFHGSLSPHTLKGSVVGPTLVFLRGGSAQNSGSERFVSDRIELLRFRRTPEGTPFSWAKNQLSLEFLCHSSLNFDFLALCHFQFKRNSPVHLM